MHLLSSCASAISTIVITSNGRFCLAGHSGLLSVPGNPAPIYVWDLANRCLYHEILGLAGSVISISVSADNKFACSIGENAIVLVFEIDSGETVFSRRFEEISGLVAFSPSFELYKFVTVSPSSISVFTLSFDLCLMKYSVTSESTSFGHIYRTISQQCVVMPDSNHVLLSSITGDVLMYNVEAAPFFMGAVNTTDPVSRMLLLPDGVVALVLAECKLALASHFPTKRDFRIVMAKEKISNIQFANNFFYFENLGSRYTINMYSGTEKIIAQYMSAPAKWIHFDGNIVFAVLKNACIYNVSSTLACSDHSVAIPVTCSAIDGNVIVLGFANGSVKAFTTTGVFCWELPSAHRGPVGAVAVLGPCVLTGGRGDSTVRTWTNSILRNQITQSNGGITHILIDQYTENLFYYSTERREIFAVLKNKIVMKFNSISFGHIRGMCQIQLPTVRDPALTDPVILTIHEEGKLVCWDIDYKDSLFIQDCPEQCHSIALVASSQEMPTVLIGCGEGKILSCNDFRKHNSCIVHQIEGFQNETINGLVSCDDYVVCVTESGIVATVSLTL